MTLFVILLVASPIILWTIDKAIRKGRSQACPDCRSRFDKRASVCPACGKRVPTRH